MKLKLTKASITHINIRMAGPDDDKVLAIDIKIAGNASANDVCEAIAPDGGLMTLWDGHGDPRLLAIDEIMTWPKWESHDIEIERWVTMTGAVRKLRFTTRGEWRADVTLTVSVANPEDGAVERLATIMGDEIKRLNVRLARPS